MEAERGHLRVHRGDEARRSNGVGSDRAGGVIAAREQHPLEQLLNGERLSCFEPHQRVGFATGRVHRG